MIYSFGLQSHLHRTFLEGGIGESLEGLEWDRCAVLFHVNMFVSKMYMEDKSIFICSLLRQLGFTVDSSPR